MNNQFHHFFIKPEQFHTWWLNRGGWTGQRGPGSTVLHIVPGSQTRDHLPIGCRCGTVREELADGTVRITHQLLKYDENS